MSGEDRKQVDISIMITTYNLENYIAETLDSVLTQDTGYSFEILVGDDGSKDKTMDILKEYQSRYPEIIQIFQMPREDDAVYNKVERAAANRMQLWEHAAGKYACFLDGDDYYIAGDRLQRMADILEQPANRDCIMCAHNLMMHYEKGSDFPLCRAKKERKISFQQYWPLMFLQANAIMFRNEEKLKNLPEALRGNFDDNNITFWLFQHGKMYYLPECMGAYRQVEGSSWNSNDELQKACSNLIGYNLELIAAPQKKRFSEIRHYPDFDYILEHIKELKPESCGPFYETAKKYRLTFAQSVYELQPEKDDISFLKVLQRRSKRGYMAAKLKRGVRKRFRSY